MCFGAYTAVLRWHIQLARPGSNSVCGRSSCTKGLDRGVRTQNGGDSVSRTSTSQSVQKVVGTCIASGEEAEKLPCNS